MARQSGHRLFVGTRHGCTGYVMHGRGYVRRRSSLSGETWRRSDAFAGSRAASVVFGGASAFVGHLWRRLPSGIKGLMDSGGFNRLCGAVREAHDFAASEVVHHAAERGKRAWPERIVRRFDGRFLGGCLNGLDLSVGQEGAGFWDLRILGAGVARDGLGIGDLVWARGLKRVGVSIGGLLDDVAAGVRTGPDLSVRVHLARVEAAGFVLDAAGKRYLMDAAHGGGFVGAASVSEWHEDDFEVDLPAVDHADGRCLFTFLGVEVAVKRKGRWKRLPAACKVYLLEAGAGIENGELKIENENGAGRSAQVVVAFAGFEEYLGTWEDAWLGRRRRWRVRMAVFGYSGRAGP